MMELSLHPSAEAVSMIGISVSSPARTRSRSDDSFVPRPLTGFSYVLH